MNNSNIASLEYDAAGREITRTLGNGLVTNMTYRNDHLFASINNPAVGNYAYSYDTNKNPTSETITGSMSGFGWSNTFDDNDRLINWQRADNLKTQAWDLSPVGNWNSLTSTSPLPPGEGQGEGTTATKNFTHGLAHELSSVNGAAVTHDAKGNLTQDERGLQLAWDMDNKLKAAQVPANATWGTPGYHTYEYDGLGRRVATTVHDAMNNTSITTIYVQTSQDSMAQVLAEYNLGSSIPLRKYVYGEYIDEPLIMVDQRNGVNNTYYYHHNRQYSVTGLSNNTGQIVERYTYTPQGKVSIYDGSGNVIPTSLVGNSYTFTGRELDTETGMFHYRARMYCAKLGRFLSRDPIGYKGGLNIWEYVGSKPILLLDPFGNEIIHTGKNTISDTIFNILLDRARTGIVCPGNSTCINGFPFNSYTIIDDNNSFAASLDIFLGSASDFWINYIDGKMGQCDGAKEQLYIFNGTNVFDYTKQIPVNPGDGAWWISTPYRIEIEGTADRTCRCKRGEQFPDKCTYTITLTNVDLKVKVVDRIDANPNYWEDGFIKSMFEFNWWLYEQYSECDFDVEILTNYTKDITITKYGDCMDGCCK